MPQRGASAIEVDVQNITKPAHAGTTGSDTGEKAWYNIAGLGDDVFMTKTTVFGTGSIVMAGYSGFHASNEISSVKMRLFMDGVQMGESDYLANSNTAPTIVSLVNNKIMSGSSIIRVDAHNYNAALREVWFFSRVNGTSRQDGSLIIGAVK